MPPNISGLRVGSFACFEAHYPMWLHRILFLHLSLKTSSGVGWLGLPTHLKDLLKNELVLGSFTGSYLLWIGHCPFVICFSSYSKSSTVAGFIRLSKRTRDETDGQADMNLCPANLSTAIFCRTSLWQAVTSVDLLEIQEAMSLKKEESDFSSQWKNGTALQHSTNTQSLGPFKAVGDSVNADNTRAAWSFPLCEPHMHELALHLVMWRESAIIYGSLLASQQNRGKEFCVLISCMPLIWKAICSVQDGISWFNCTVEMRSKMKTLVNWKRPEKRVRPENLEPEVQPFLVKNRIDKEWRGNEQEMNESI